MRRALSIGLVALAATGCGQARRQPPPLAHAEPPAGFREVTVGGASFRRPVNWADLEPAPPLAGGVRSRTATVAVWRYPRTEPLPAGAAALKTAQAALVDRVRARNPSFVLRSSRVGRHRIELTGRQTVAGFTVDVRSVHVFRDGAEVVVDAYAPPADFPRVDRTVFGPLIDSLRVG